MEEQPDNRRRNLIAMAILVVVLFVLIAFFIVRSRTVTSPNSNNNPSAPVTLQWWGVFLDASTVQPLIDEYNADNPNVKIQYVNKWPGGNRDGAESQYYASLDAVLKENNPLALPDIFMVDNTMVGYYENQTTPAPSSVISATEVATNFYPIVSNNLVKAGQVRGLPLWVDTLAIVYNRNLLLQAGRQTVPTEWTEFKNLSQQLTTVVGTDRILGFAAGTTANTSFGTDLLQLLFLQDGISLTDSTGRPNFANNAAAVNTLSFFKGFAGTGGSWTAANADNDALAFMKGKLAMLVAPSWRVNDFLDINSSQSLGLNIGVSKMPQISGSAEINWGSYWANVVSSKRPNSVEAWKFIKWLTEPTQLRKLRTADAQKGRSFSFIYPRPDMRAEIEANAGQYLQPYISAVSSATSWYMGDGVKLRAALAELIESAGAAGNLQTAQTKALEALQSKL